MDPRPLCYLIKMVTNVLGRIIFIIIVIPIIVTYFIIIIIIIITFK
jgi:hypothetical protein